MQTASELYDQGKIRVGRAISHTGEKTLALCLQSLDSGGVNFHAHRIVSGVNPVAEAFNLIMDFAVKADVDLLFHVASDVIVKPNAVRRLMEVLQPEKHYLAVAKGYDPMFGSGASVGMLLWNMRVVGREFRFRDVYRTDMEICDRIEAATGLQRVYTPKTEMLGYHHPIWTAEDLYAKILYSYPKYLERRQKDIETFVEEGLSRNPTNKVLLSGEIALRRVKERGAPTSSKDMNGEMGQLFKDDTADLHLSGRDYLILHKQFKHYAQRVMRTHQDCVAIDEDA